MVKKNLFSKVLSGVLALGMVATMLPAMSLTSEAADTATITRNDMDRYVRIYNYNDLTASQKANPYTIPSWTAEEDAANGGTWTKLSGTDNDGTTITVDDISKDLTLLVVPTTWFEFSSGMQRFVLKNEGGTPLASGSTGQGAMVPKRNSEDVTGRTYTVTIPGGTLIADEEYSVDLDTPTPIIVTIDVNAGSGVEVAQLNYEPQQGRVPLTANGTTTYQVRYVPEGYVFPKDDPDDLLSKEWDVQNNSNYTYGATAGARAEVAGIAGGGSMGRFQIRRDHSTGTWLDVTTKDGVAQFQGNTNSYGAEILLSARRSVSLAGDFKLNIQADAANWNDGYKEGDLKSYKSHELVDIIDPVRSGTDGIAMNEGPQTNDARVNYGISVDSTIQDVTNYIGIRAINDRVVAAPSAETTPKTVAGPLFGTMMSQTWNTGATAGIVYNRNGRVTTTARADFKWNNTVNAISENDEIATPNDSKDKSFLPDYFDYNNIASIQLVVNPVNILRYYVYGLAGKNGVTVNGKTFADDAAFSVNGLAGNRKVAGQERYGYQKHISINFGDAVRGNGSYKFENGDATDPTDDVSVRNIYRWQWVFRDVDGYRFDMKNGNVWDYDSLKSEPVEWPYDEGDYKTGTGRNYVLRGYNAGEKYLGDVKEGDTIEFMVKFDPNCDYSDAEVVAVGYDGGTIVTETVEWDKATGKCKFTFGNKFPYRFTVQKTKPMKKVTVSVIPEKDYIYEPTHQENFTTLINAFYQYDPFFVTKAEINTCNYANPRFQVFVEAHEEDIALLDLVAFARRQVVGGAETYFGHSFPVGKTKFKIRFNDTFTNQAGDILNSMDRARNENGSFQHGSFDLDRSDDRYGKGPNFKLLVNGKEVTVADDDTFEIDLTEDTKIEAEGIVRKYYVYMPKLAGFNFELDSSIEQQREEYQRYGEMDREQGSLTDTQYNAIDFRSSVIEGGQYKFKLALTEAAANSRPVVKADNTVLTPDKDGWYSFEVNSDTFVTVDGITVNNAFKDTQNLPQEEQDAIDWLLANGMTVGDGDGNFMPQSNTKRGDFVLMLYRYYGQPAATGNGGFSDVAADAYYANAIAWGSGKGIVNGYPDGTFRPNNIITRAEVANILSKLCGLNSGTANPFVDVNAGDWYYNAVNRCFAAGIVNGTTQTTFTPNAGIIRAHYALMLYRSHSMLPAK